MQDRVIVADEKYLVETMQKTDISGVSIALLSDDGVIRTKAFGFTDETLKNQVTPDTVFGAASLSKVVFAYLVLKLIQDHQLSLDEPLSETLSFGDFCKEMNLTCDPSIKDIALDITSILSHTTGLDDSKDGVIQKTKSGHYWYSGVPLWYLQKVIEAKTGKSLEDLAKKYVFSPDACDMKNTTFYTNESAVCANTLRTTAEAYANFVKKWMHEEDELFKSAFMPIVSMKKDDWAHAVGVNKNDLKCVAWGLGWGLELDEKGQVKKAYHTGDMGHWRALVAIDFDKKEAIVYFANSPNGFVLADQIVSPHVALPHAFNYFSKKYGFAVEYEPDWKDKEEARFNLIKQGALTYAAPHISQLQSSFFKTVVMEQMQAENKLMPVSISWWEIELSEKRQVLETFWWERVIRLNQNSVDSFKKHIINTHFPKSPQWEKKIDKLFSDAVARKIDFDGFFAELKYLPMIHIRTMANAENIPLPHANVIIEPKLEIQDNDLINIKRYMVERGMTGSVSFGFGDKGIITPDYSDGSKCCYAMHSVGKVFTGMLTLVMIQKGIILEKELTEPLSQDFIESLDLPMSLKTHLLENKITLHQLMTHKAGLGDYLGKYGDAISQGTIPEMNRAEDFLQFAEIKTYPVDKEKYSNLGILLVGLAIKHAYEKKHGPCEYDQLLSKYIVDKIAMPSFSSKKPDQNVKYNLEDPIAPHIAGSPAGGYWVTTEDLAKFGQWIYQSCQKDPTLEELIKKYGQEFYNEEHNMISHGGAISSSSAFLSVSLNTGAVIATLSDQPDMAFELNSMMQTHVFAKRPEVAEDEIETSYRKEF